MQTNGTIIPNPYQVGGKIRNSNQFVGREREIRSILSLVATMQSVSLIGERRIGKSSLLLYLKENGKRLLNDETIEFFYLDFQEPINSPEQFYIQAHELMKSAKSNSTPEGLDATIETGSAKDRFDAAIDGKKIVWCLDEFEQTIEEEDFNADFFKHLRHLAQSGNLSLIVATKTSLYELCKEKEDLTSGFPNVFPILSLGELTKEEAYKLVTQPHNNHYFNDSQAQLILELGGCNPYKLNLACSIAFELKQESSNNFANELTERFHLQLQNESLHKPESEFPEPGMGVASQLSAAQMHVATTDPAPAVTESSSWTRVLVLILIGMIIGAISAPSSNLLGIALAGSFIISGIIFLFFNERELRRQPR